jgi:Skp family chaperone for outer membrane proteins
MADEATTTPAETQATTKTDAGNGAGSGGADRTFTQADLDRVVKERLERQRQQYEPKLAALPELEEKAQRLAEIEESRKSEAEKLVSAIDKANQTAQQAQEREKAAVERASNTLIRAAVVSEASRQQAIDPDAVYALVDKSRLKLGDDDRVDGVEDAVKELLKERSYLVGRPSGFDGGARQTATTGNTRADLNDQFRKEWLQKQGHV